MHAGPDHPAGRPKHVPLVAACLLAGLAGLGVRVALWGHYRLAGSDCDGAAYMELARHIALGAGYVSNALYHSWNAPRSFPHPESLWSPLYPYLVAAALHVTPHVWTAAKAVSLLFGAAVPPLTVLLAVALTGRRSVGMVAGVFAALEPTLVGLSLRSLTEIGTIALLIGAYCLAFVRGRWAGAALGLAMGLAYLQKYQSGLLWIAVIAALVLERGRRGGLRALVLPALVFALTLTPWLVRNARTFGDPFYSDIRWNLLCEYRAFGGSARYWALTQRPPDLLAYATRHPGETLRHLVGGLRLIQSDAWHHHLGSLLLLPLALAGLPAAARRWRRWLPFAMYALALAVGAGLTIPRARFLLSALPALLILAAAGGVAIFEWARARPGPAGRLAAAAAALLVAACAADLARNAWAAARDRTSGWNPWGYVCALETQGAAPWVAAHVPPGTPVIVNETSHAALLLDRPALRLPFSDAGVLDLMRRFRAGWLIATERDLADHLPGWRLQPPRWARREARLVPELYAAAELEAGYRYCSPLEVFELDPAAADSAGAGSPAPAPAARAGADPAAPPAAPQRLQP